MLKVVVVVLECARVRDTAGTSCDDENVTLWAPALDHLCSHELKRKYRNVLLTLTKHRHMTNTSSKRHQRVE